MHAKRKNDGSGGEPTHALVVEVPTILGMLLSKHGKKDDKPDETNFENITLEMKDAAGYKPAETGDGITIVLGKLFNDLKRQGIKEKMLKILPTPAELGAKPGNMNKNGGALRYCLDHFNNSDGSLKFRPIKCAWKKQSVEHIIVMYGYIIAIRGTENDINIATPTAANKDTEFGNFFG